MKTTFLTLYIVLIGTDISAARPVIPRGRVGPDDAPFIIRRSTIANKKRAGAPADIYHPSLLVSRQLQDDVLPPSLAATDGGVSDPQPVTAPQPTLKKAVTFSPDNGRQSGFITIPAPAPGNARQTLFFDFEMPIAGVTPPSSKGDTKKKDKEEDCEEEDKKKNKSKEKNNKDKGKGDGKGKDEGSWDSSGLKDDSGFDTNNLKDQLGSSSEGVQGSKLPNTGQAENFSSTDVLGGQKGHEGDDQDFRPGAKGEKDVDGTKIIFKPTADDEPKGNKKAGNDFLMSTAQKNFDDYSGDGKKTGFRGGGEDTGEKEAASAMDAHHWPATLSPSKGLSEADLLKGATAGGDEKKMQGEGDEKGGNVAETQTGPIFSTIPTDSGRKFDLESVKSDETINAHKGDVVAYVNDGDKKEKTGTDDNVDEKRPKKPEQKRAEESDLDIAWYPRAIRQRREHREEIAAATEVMMQRRTEEDQSTVQPHRIKPRQGTC